MDATLLPSLSLFGLGFILGLQHALEADHIITVSMLVSQTKSLKKSSILGALWGIGHTLTLFVVGLGVLVFRLSIPIELAHFFEFLVGLLLVILGADLLRKVVRGEIHLHKHEHDEGVVHAHLHSHSKSPFHNHSHRSFAVGMIHGLAGSGAIVVLVLTTVQSILQGMIFILIFGAGSILGMWITSTMLAYSFKFISRFERVNNALRVIAGVVSMVLGLVVMISTGF